MHEWIPAHRRGRAEGEREEKAIRQGAGGHASRIHGDRDESLVAEPHQRDGQRVAGHEQPEEWNSIDDPQEADPDRYRHALLSSGYWRNEYIPLEPITAAVIGLGLNLGAYGAEVVRGAVQAVPRGQWEASTALNMTRAMALRRIVLPQAFVAMIPPWGNLFIELLKATSLVSLITITDLTFKAKGISDVTLRTAEVFNVALVIYLCIALVITYAMRTLERSATRGLARGRSA